MKNIEKDLWLLWILLEETVGCVQLDWMTSSSDFIKLCIDGTVLLEYANFPLNPPWKTDYTYFGSGSAFFANNFSC